MLFNITERRRYEQELLRAKADAEEQREQLRLQNEQLLRTNSDLDTFVYTASHDLRQPINNLAGLFDELRRSATFADPSAGHMLGLVDSALEQLRETIEGLTAVVQLPRLVEAAPAEAIALRPFTEEIVRSLPTSAAQFVLDFSALPALHLPRTSLSSILLNLLSNAVQYAQPGRAARVSVASALVDGEAVLSVADNGRGINLARHTGELFQLFRRFHPDVPGTGVGLFLVKRLVTQAGGRLEVSSAVGEGTTFRVVLPQPA